ncbi:hypothetical protein I3271_19085 [Photobacterium leiognathi]|uniref:hypothetical protein n=1 Tax=Photobacterium leiognathi TaxID=553611 RepID=UPI001EDCBF3A|nr:hypothetical protein [Photobacterium leiognathi]MCG3886783.1 hypothetical protein [Photobacterium leiognathi]
MNILFLDSEKSVSKLLNIKSIASCHTVEFDGNRYFGLPDIFFFEKYDVILYLNFQNRANHLIIEQVNKIGISTVFISDGIYDWDNCFNNYTHKFFSLFTYYQLDSKYVFYCGDDINLRYLSKRNYGTEFISYIPFRNRVKGDEEVVCKEFDILITTANTAYFNDEEFFSLSTLINKTLSCCDDLNLSYKLRIFDKRLVNSLNFSKEIDNVTSGDISELAVKARAVIATPSSLNIDVSQLDIPIGTYLYRDFPSQHTGGWIIFSDLDIKRVLRELLDNKSVKYKERMLYQKIMLEQEINDNNLIEMVKSDKRCVDSNLIGKKTSYFSYFISFVLFNLRKAFK